MSELIRYDSWLTDLYGDTLDRIDAACAGLEAGAEALGLFRDLDDDLWAVLLSGDYDAYPHIRAVLPQAPDISIQARWNGWTGTKLLTESKAFYRRVKQVSSAYSRRGLSDSRLLDFGCGWGRLTRFFARDVAPGALFACDPVHEILDVCRDTGVPARLALCDFVPERLPFEERFDLVFAFSVFTHLSEPAHQACLQAIHASLEPGGLLVLTVRPTAYLDFCEAMRPLRGSPADDRSDEPRYLFVPHPADPDHPQFHGGEMTYGETVITLPYVRRRWAPAFELLEVSLLTEDIYQVVLTLRKRD
jgi:SAM-dependent methyltransferase